MNLNEVLNLRKRGLSVFPVSNETKVPLVKWERLQNDLPTVQEVTEWFTPNNRSVGVATGKVSNLFLLDFDFSKHPESKRFYEEHKNDLPRTWCESTRSGGLHFYFRWTSLLDEKQTNTTSKLFGGVDTKGQGGYSKISPSEGYKWINAPTFTPLAEVPRWLVDSLPDKNRYRQSDEDPEDVAFRGERDVEEAVFERSYIQEILDDVKPGNRNDSFTRAAGSLRNRGYSVSDIYALLSPKAREVNFDLSELQLLTESVGRYKPSQQVNNEDITDLKTILSEQIKTEWLVEPRLISKKSITFIAGLPEARKSWILMDLAIAAASGAKWLGRFDCKKARVLYLDQERSRASTVERFNQLLAGRELKPEDLKGSLVLRPQSRVKLNLPNSFEAFDRLLEKTKPDLILVDSFKKIHSNNELSSQDMQIVFTKCEELKDKHGCSFVFIHHEPKGVIQRRKEDFDVKAEDASGTIDLQQTAEHFFNILRTNEGSMFYHTKNNLGDKVSPCLIKVIDMDESKERIKVEAL